MSSLAVDRPNRSLRDHPFQVRYDRPPPARCDSSGPSIRPVTNERCISSRPLCLVGFVAGRLCAQKSCGVQARLACDVLFLDGMCTKNPSLGQAWGRSGAASCDDRVTRWQWLLAAGMASVHVFEFCRGLGMLLKMF